jgi:CelD/BcsL family acetyltransferase involved in cellulose biosynthesis
LLRGSIRGEICALALLGASTLRRHYGLVRSRSLFLNETGDPIFDSIVIEHNGLLVSAACASAASDALVRWFAGLGTKADELRLRGSLLHLSEAVIEACGLRRTEIVNPSYFVDLSRLKASCGEISPILSANARQQLRSSTRYLERCGALQLRHAANLAEALEFFEGLRDLHAASWQQRGVAHAFSNPTFEPFHRLLIERNFAEGCTQLLRASAGDRVIGYLYNFRLGGHVYAYQSGFAYDDRRARPGTVAHAMAIRDAYRSGAAVYDFLAGHNRLKESFSTHSEAMLWQVVQQPRLAFRVENFARRVKHAVRARITA